MLHYFENLQTRLSEGRKYKRDLEAGFRPLGRELYSKFNRFRAGGPKPLFCYLPFNSLTFSFSGQVLVCSYNRDIELGRYPANSIDEIWNGANARRLREHMSHNDLEFGCRHCKYFFDKGKFTNLRPLAFDKYYKNTDAVFPQVFEFELSNTCNLECQMCHGEVSSSIRKNRDRLPPIPSPYDDAFVKQLEKYIPHLKEAKFYGGEPLLIPIYYQIWDRVKALNPELDLFVITNGTQWSDKIERLFNDLNFDVAVSIDALNKEKLEHIRKNVNHAELLANIRRFSKICARNGTHLSLSFTVQKDNWDQLPLIINLCNEVNAYIYVSYLERPTQFMVTDLPKSELRKIREYLDSYKFPQSSPKEQHNHKCFEDFKHYLEVYIAADEVKKYFEYEFNRDLLLSHQNEESPTPGQRSISSGQFLSWIDEQYLLNKKLSDILPKEAFLRKVHSIISDYPEEDQCLLRSFMCQAGFKEVQMIVKETSVEELKKNCAGSLDEFRKHNHVPIIV